MKKFFIKLCIASSLMVFGSAFAFGGKSETSTPDTAPDYVAIIGTGQFSCGSFVDYKEKNNSAQIELIVQWTWGFLSAYNTRGSFGSSWKRVSHINQMPDASTVVLYLENYCRNHPLDIIENGIFSMIKDMGGDIFWRSKK